jgi:uncharacterized tellurite resistance protein B-like protein
MSWVIDMTGTKSSVANKVTEQLDRIAKNYDGKQEAKDVLLAKERILALVAALDLPEKSTEWNAVRVTGSGSHTLTANGIADAHVTFSVKRTRIDID